MTRQINEDAVCARCPDGLRGAPGAEAVAVRLILHGETFKSPN